MDESPDRYRLEVRLGEGSAGEVWRALDTRLKRRVALKLLHHSAQQDREMVARFWREAELAARLRHDNIVHVNNFGRIDGRLFIDSDLIEGRNLATVLRDEPMTTGRVSDVVDQIADALDVAHGLTRPPEDRIVHRDVKPANVLVADQPRRSGGDRVYLTDFGVARALASDAAITLQGTVVGTPAYMSPELLATESADHRTDVYALAVLLFEMLAGRLPYDRRSVRDMINAHVWEAVPAVTARAPHLPPEIDRVLARGLAKDPDDRYPTAPALAADARSVLAGVPSHTPVGRTALATPPLRTANLVPAPAGGGTAGTGGTGTGGTLPPGASTPAAGRSLPAPASAPSSVPPATPPSAQPGAPPVPQPLARRPWFASGPHYAGLAAEVLLVPGYVLGLVRLDASVFVAAVLLYGLGALLVSSIARGKGTRP